MQRQTSRWAPAFAAVLVLAACGGSDDGRSAPVEPGPTVDSTSPPDDDDLRPPTPIEVVSGGTDGGTVSRSVGAGDSAPAADAQVATSEMRIAPWIAEYVVGDGMPALPTDDTGYVFDSTGTVTSDQVAAVGAALGVDGEPVRIDDGGGVSWRVGPDDGSAPSVWVYEDGQQGWNYNSGRVDDLVDVACAGSVDADGAETSDCPQPEPPVGVPSAAEAEQRATEVVSALGVAPATVTFETYADEWSASVNASDTTDQRTPLRSWYFGFGAGGELQYASGSLALPASVGPYPLVDLDTAVARLSDGYFGGFGGGIAMAEPILATETDPTVVEESAPVDPPVVSVGTLPVDSPVVSVGTLPVDPPVEMPAVDPPVDQEAIVVTLVDVQADLWWAWDADGVAWLLPAYRFIDTDGGWHVVPAVTDEFLIQADPSAGDPMPVEGDGGIGDGAEPVPPPESLPASTDDPEGALPTLEEFVGLSIEEFTVEAESIGFSTRIVMLDGETLAGTADYRTDRVNVVVEGPRVVAIDSIG